jgi:hypothetical protein
MSSAAGFRSVTVGYLVLDASRELSPATGPQQISEPECRVIQPLLPKKPHGVPRVDGRQVLNGIFRVLRSGSPWRDLSERGADDDVAGAQRYSRI